MSKQKDLKGVLGGREMYGGRSFVGYSDVKLVGVTPPSTVHLIVNDEARDADETTFDRYQPKPVQVSQNVVLGEQGQPGGILVSLDTAIENEFVVAGIRITFKEVRNASVVYVIEDLLPLGTKRKT